MPKLTRWYIKTAMVYLVVGLLLGVGSAARSPAGLPGFLGAIGPTYLHLLTVGWISQMIFGVAYWMFPRGSRERPRGSETLALATYVTLNAGLVLRAAAEPLLAQGHEAAWDWALLASSLLQWLAAVLFVANIWGRVKER